VSQFIIRLRFVFTLSRGLVFISNANPACSCVYICKFQFRPIHPPLGDYQPLAQPEAPSAQPEAPSATEGEALRVEEERSGVTPYRNWQTPYLQYLHRGELPPRPSRSSAIGAARQVVRLAGGREGALPPQPLMHPPAMHIHRRRPGALTRNTLGGLRSPHNTPSPCWKRLPTRFLLADRGGRRH
jgi:hypothetical protein